MQVGWTKGIDNNFDTLRLRFLFILPLLWVLLSRWDIIWDRGFGVHTRGWELTIKDTGGIRAFTLPGTRARKVLETGCFPNTGRTWMREAITIVNAFGVLERAHLG